MLSLAASDEIQLPSCLIIAVHEIPNASYELISTHIIVVAVFMENELKYFVWVVSFID